MRRYFTFRSNRHHRPLRQKGIFAPVPAAVLVLAVLGLAVLGPAAPGAAAHAPPTITQPVPGAFVNTSIAEVKGTAAGDAVLVRLQEGAGVLADTGPSGGYWSASVSLAEGAHTVRARSKDASGVWSAFSDPVTFTVDTVAPAAPVITVPASGAVLGFSDVTVEGTAEPAATVTVTVSTGGTATAATGPSGAWAFTRAFTNATHTLTARARDAAGNLSLPSAPVTFTVDTIPPVAPVIFTPANSSFVGTSAVTVKGSAEPGTTLLLFEGATIGTTTVPSDGTWSIGATFPEGSHTISARAKDAASNISPESAPSTFTVDVTPPPAPVILRPAAGAFVPSDVEIAGTAEPHATVLLIKGSVVQATTRADASGAWSVRLTLYSGPHTFQARARDRAGNLGPLSPLITFTADSELPEVRFTTQDGAILLPAAGPDLEGVAEDNIGVLGIELEYYDLLGRAVAKVNADCFSCPATAADWSSDFSPGVGRFTVKAYAIDRAGNRSLPAVITFVRI